jgi:excisionase family DNA binding protein
MIEIKLDETELKAIYLAEVQKRLDNIEYESMLIGTKELTKMLQLSWPTIEKEFISDPKFPAIRIGKKWLFNRMDVKDYVNQWWSKKKMGSKSTKPLKYNR